MVAEEYGLVPAGRLQIVPLVDFYNKVVAYSRAKKNRRMEWSDFTKSQIEQAVRERKLYVLMNHGQVCAAVMLDEEREAWPDEEGLLPPYALRFSKLAVDPSLAGKQFGRTVVWPCIVAYAKEQGYTAIFCEAHKVTGLHQFYTSLGMAACSPKKYYNSYYGQEIQADRFCFMIAE